MSTRRRASGFTLIEVLVALAIVTAVMAVLLGALSSAADTTSYLRDKSFAEWIAMNRIAEVRLQANKPDEGKITGKVEFAGRQWLWEQVVRDVEIPGLRRVDVSVRPADVPGADDRSWYTTVAGVFGDAVAPPSGNLPNWQHTSTGTGPGQQSPGEDSEEESSGKPGQSGQRPGQPGEPPRERRPSPRTRLGT